MGRYGNRVSENDRDEMSVMYEGGKSAYEIMRVFDVNIKTVYSVLREKKVYIRTLSEAYTKYSVNHDYFERIDSPDKAYFFGLLLADGCNIRDGVTITLQMRDRHIIEQMAKCLDFGGKIYNMKRANGYSYARIDIRSDKLAKDLSLHGCVPAKTFIKEFPKTISPELYAHFIRGYFDGNGCIHSVKSTGQFLVSFVSTKHMLVGIRDVLCAELGLNDNPLRETKSIGIYTITWGGNKQVKRIFDFLYREDSGLFLTRKKEKFAPLMDISELESILKEETVNK